MSIRIPGDVTRFYKYELDEYYDNLIDELDRFLFMKSSKSRRMYLKEIIPNLFQGAWSNFVENETLKEIYLQNDREIFHLLLESYMYSLPHPTSQKKVRYEMNANKFIPKSKKKIVNNKMNENEKIIDSTTIRSTTIRSTTIGTNTIQFNNHINNRFNNTNEDNTRGGKIRDLNALFLWDKKKEMIYSDTISIETNKRNKKRKNEELKKTKSDDDQLNNIHRENIFEELLGIKLPDIEIPSDQFDVNNYGEVDMEIYELFDKKFPPDWLDFDGDDKVIRNPETDDIYFRVSIDDFENVFDTWYRRRSERKQKLEYEK